MVRLAEIAGSLQRLLDIQFERARVGFRDRSFRAVSWLLFAIFLLTLMVTAGLYFVRGLARLMTELLGNLAWAGDLAAAALILALAATIGFAARGWLRRSHLRRLRRKFEPESTVQEGTQ